MPAIGAGILFTLAHGVVVVTVHHPHLGPILGNGRNPRLRGQLVDVDDTGEAELARRPGQPLAVVAVGGAGESDVAHRGADFVRHQFRKGQSGTAHLLTDEAVNGKGAA